MSQVYLLNNCDVSFILFMQQYSPVKRSLLTTLTINSLYILKKQHFYIYSLSNIIIAFLSTVSEVQPQASLSILAPSEVMKICQHELLQLIVGIRQLINFP